MKKLFVRCSFILLVLIASLLIFATFLTAQKAAPLSCTTQTVCTDNSVTITGPVTITVEQNVTPILVSIQPTAVQVQILLTQQFLATVVGTTNTAVTWSVVEGATYGTVSGSGLYTAPASVPGGTPTGHVRATSVADVTKHADAAVTIVNNLPPPPCSVSISPQAAGVFISQSQQFTATTTNCTPNTVFWTVNGVAGGNGIIGTVSPTGLYTAPIVIPTPATVTVTAVSNADNTKVASAQVTVSTVATGENAYCGPGDVPNYGGPDDVAAMPRRCYYTPLSATPANSGVNRNVTDNASMALAITNAQCGDRIVLSTPTSLTNIFTFPDKGCGPTNYIWIMGNEVNTASFPLEGGRVSPCFMGVASVSFLPNYPCPVATDVMPKITVFGGASPSGGFIFQGGYYRVMGIEFVRDCTLSNPVFNMINLTDIRAKNIIIDRNVIHGCHQEGNFPMLGIQAKQTEISKGIEFGQNQNLAIMHNYIYDIYCVGNGLGCDANTIGGAIGTVQNSGWGNYKFYDNFLESAAEGILLGGSDGPQLSPPGCTNRVNCNEDIPSDIENRHNTFFKSLGWNGNTATQVVSNGWPFEKNGYEWKCAGYLLDEGNIVINTWFNNQPGYATSFATKNQISGGVGLSPTCAIKNVTHRYNYSYNTSYGLGIYASEDACSGDCYSQGTINVSEHDNIYDFINVNHPDGNQTSSDGFELFAGSTATTGNVPWTNVHIRHDTIPLNVRSLNIFGADVPAGNIKGFVFQDNIVSQGQFGFLNVGDGGCDQGVFGGFNILQACANGQYTWDHNVIVNGPSNGSTWPTDGHGLGNFFPVNLNAVGFANPNAGNAGDYHLLSTSPYKGKAHDNRDPGADVDKVNLYIGGGVGPTDLSGTNNTSACAANGSPSYCNAGFLGFRVLPTETHAQTQLFDAPPGVVSPLLFRSLLYPGANTRILAETQPWFCNTSDPCNTHRNIGLNMNDPNYIAGMIQNMIKRGVNGVVPNYYGISPKKAFNYQTVVLIKNYLSANNPLGTDGTPFTMTMMVDKGAVQPFCTDASTTWSNTTNYNVGDGVGLNSIGYIALVANVNKSPDVNPTQWQLLNTCISNAIIALSDDISQNFANQSGGGGNAPTITAMFPPQGFSIGGESITVKGSGFIVGTTVTIGGASAAAVLVDSNTLTVTAPAGSLGAQNVVVTNTAGTATLTGGYFYLFNPSTTCTWTAGDRVCTMTYTDSFGSETRSMRILIPSTRPTHPATIAYYHGTLTGTGDSECENAGWNTKATASGFILMCPVGVQINPGAGNLTRSWNAYYNGATYDVGHPPDDSYFNRELEALVYKNLSTDPTQNFLTGFSAGGHGSYRFATDNPGLIAAVGSEASAYLQQDPAGPLPFPTVTSPFSVITLHSTLDGSFKYCGRSDNVTIYNSIDGLFNKFSGSTGDQCTTITPTSNMCTADFTGTPTSVSVKVGTACKNGTEVTAYQLLGGSHLYFPNTVQFTTPPGTPTAPYNPNLNTGTGTNSVDIFYNYFIAHAKQTPSTLATVPVPTWFEHDLVTNHLLVELFMTKVLWPLANWQTIWNTVKPHTDAYAHPIDWVDQMSGDFAELNNTFAGQHAWTITQPYVDSNPASQFCWNLPTCGSFNYYNDFYTKALANPTKIAIGYLGKGFDWTVANWNTTPKKTAQQCGQVLIMSGQVPALRGFSSSNQLKYAHLVTWNDYEEGHELETGVDNCLNVISAMNGDTLQTSLNFTDATYGSLTTVDHVELYYGTSLSSLFPINLNVTPASVITTNLSTLVPPGTWQIVSYAVGKAGILNHQSNLATYTH